MTLNISVSVDSSVFEGEEGRSETAKILKAIADRIESGSNSGKILDVVTGNVVGKFFHESR